MRKMRTVVNLLSQGGVFYLYYSVLEIKFWRYFQDKEWTRAIKVGNRAATYFNDNKTLNTSLAECYQQIGAKKDAYRIVEKTMGLNFNLSNCIQQIEDKLRKGNGIVDSKYINLGGRQNIGFIEHNLKNGEERKVLLTKIAKTKAARDFLFYNQIYPIIKMKNVTPKLVNLHTMNSTNVSFITLEKINSVKIKFNKQLLDNLIEANNILTSIKYGEICEWFPKPNFDKCVVIDERTLMFPYSALHSFVSIHKEATNFHLFREINERMQKLNYSQESIDLVASLENVILTKKLYRRINPKFHYSIQHGDMQLQNMLFDKDRNKLYLIDWGHMRIAPTWTDMAGFLGMMKVPFDFIMTNYFSNPLHRKPYEPLEKIFFIYSLIVIWFLNFTQEEFECSHDKYLIPAIEELEKLAIKIAYEIQEVPN